MEHFENFWEKNGTFWEILRKIRVQPEPSGRALCEKPYRSSPPLFARLSKCQKLLRKNWDNVDGILFTHTSVTGQQKKQKMNSLTETKCKVIVSIPRVIGDAANGTQKMMKTGFAFAWRTIKPLQVSALESKPSTQFGPHGNCQLHRQLKKLTVHLHCNQARKEFNCICKLPRKCDVTACSEHIFSFIGTVYLS